MAFLCKNCIDGKLFFLSQFNAVHEHISGNNNFLADYPTRKAEYLNHDNSIQDQKNEDIIIDFNEYLETVLEGLEQLDTG